MKFRLDIRIVLMTLSFFVSSCFNDLDPKSLGGNVVDATNVYKTVADYKSGLAKLYASFAVSGQQGPAGQSDIGGIDEGFGQYLRAYWNAQQLTTDEALIGWDDQTIQSFHYHTWSPSDVFLTALYYRINYTISIANEYIRATEGNSNSDVVLFRNEARFIRALAYTHGIDLFGNIPFTTEVDKPGTSNPRQGSRAELFNYVESELLDIEDLLGEARFEYGRADKIAASMLLAKLYLNAVVYIGEDRYTQCIEHVNKVISSSYTLSPQFNYNFLADNHTSPEIIFSINFDGTSTQTYGGTTYIINAQLGGSMNIQTDFGSRSAWSGLRTTSGLVDLFEAGDGRFLFWTDGQSKEINNVGLFTDGYAVGKFRNVTKTGETAPNVAYDGGGNTFMDVDFPLFRLADAYLMYAEAVVKGGQGGSIGQAVDLVNRLRERAFGNTSGNITAGELNMDFILDERGRELYWEGHRRTDLIRHGKFTGGAYLWPWKGNVKEGASTPAYRDLFPIPADDRAANPNLDQNFGY